MVSLIKQGGAFGRAKASRSSHIFSNQGKFGRGGKHELNYKRPWRDTLISKSSVIRQGGSRSTCTQSFVVITLVVVAMSLLALLYLHLLDLVTLEAHVLALGSCNLSLL